MAEGFPAVETHESALEEMSNSSPAHAMGQLDIHVDNDQQPTTNLVTTAVKRRPVTPVNLPEKRYGRISFENDFDDQLLRDFDPLSQTLNDTINNQDDVKDINPNEEETRDFELVLGLQETKLHYPSDQQGNVDSLQNKDEQSLQHEQSVVDQVKKGSRCYELKYV